MQTITPFLWFTHQAEQAVDFYTSIFKGSRILRTSRYSKGMQRKAGSVLTIDFRILGQQFTALNGGAVYKFNPATSFVIHCKTQKEVDYYWRRLSAGGREIQCGWLVDKFGVSWQVTPEILLKLITDKDPAKVERVTKAMMKMVKLNIRAIERAAAAK